MAKLKDLVNVNINRDVIQIQGADIPIKFTMETFAHIGDNYEGGYTKFEKDMNKMLSAKNTELIGGNITIMRLLVYGMVRSGGTECTLEELEDSIVVNELVSVYQKALSIFTGQNFQSKDMKRIKSGKK
ncbi:hypothetical protein [Listeria monocytogenes]|uniref:hypothetical protein n=1 Tax=Listeria monocytogenes TaxID=1639 RepID=UPI0011EADD52|nr:hypothetical protein [Listeria monocytogenes]TYV04632.1 hypothetical protein FZ054_09425 [Listeria monocytogenes]